MILEHKNNPKNLRIIKTGRTLESINTAVKKGYKPLLKKLKPDPFINSKYALVKNKTTGKIEKIGDFRFVLGCRKDEYEILIDFTFYYPYHFPNPFAAYLLPKDIIVGETVFLEDLIEDYVGMTWNQGDVYRLDSCEAIWNGTDFEIQYDFRKDVQEIIG